MKKDAAAANAVSKTDAHDKQQNSVVAENGHVSNEEASINGNGSSKDYQDTPEPTSENGRLINGTDDEDLENVNQVFFPFFGAVRLDSED